MSNTGDLVSRVYSNFRGVDFRGEEINIVRSPDSVNMWKDYKETESISTRPGMELLNDLGDYFGTVYSISFYKDEMLVHIGQRLLKIVDDTVTLLSGTPLNGGEVVGFGLVDGFTSNSFVFEDKWYFLDGNHYVVYDGDTIKEVEGYVPTTSIGRKPVATVDDPVAGGTIFEDINLLQPRRINTFLADGTSKVFWLDATDVDTNPYPIVKVNGKEVERGAFELDPGKGRIVFTKAPEKPLTDGQDNVSVEFSKTLTKHRRAIQRCKLVQPFDNRVFFTGNDEYPNAVWHCSLNDPTYVSDLDYYREGMDEAKVTGIVAGNNALWVFREPSDANTNVFYHTPTIDDEYGKIYPSTHSSVTTGCIGKAINFNDDIVFFSDRGMEGISGDVTTEQVVAHRSTLVDRKLTAEENYTHMILAEWEGYLLVIIDSRVYLADSRGVFTNEDHIEYEWFYWELENRITCAKVHNGVLYLGAGGSIYTLTDPKANVESYWVTPKDKFKYPHMQKTTNKKSCTIEALGDFSVSAKTNRDDDFMLLDDFENVTDACSCRVKKKKFKDIQLKFHSHKRFALETATLECFIGGYLKNL